MTGGRRHARNRRQRNQAIDLARKYGAVCEAALDVASAAAEPADGDGQLRALNSIVEERDRLAVQLRQLECGQDVIPAAG